jgi:hypothetical protein
MNFVYGEMKVNLHFATGTDVGALCDNILAVFPRMTAFQDATEHRAFNGDALYIAKEANMNVFTNYKDIIVIDPLTEAGEEFAALLLMQMPFTRIDAQPYVVKK